MNVQLTRAYLWQIKSAGPGAQAEGDLAVERSVRGLNAELPGIRAQRGFSVYKGPEVFNQFFMDDGTYDGVIAYWRQGQKSPKPNPSPARSPFPNIDAAPFPSGDAPRLPPVIPLPIPTVIDGRRPGEA